MDWINIREILDQVQRGQIRIPAFQRGFVWEPDRVAYLMDSIYKRYPFGSLLFWRTRERLKVERDLGPFTLPPPLEDYPVDYVLDGQQRITSIFGTFQTELAPDPAFQWQDVYFDLSAKENAQDTQFVALLPTEVDPARHFPLRTLFDTTAYRAATRVLDDATALRLDKMQEVFKETQIPIQTSKTENKAVVAIIFERVNRQGVELDTLQLLSAWTWSEEFQLHEHFQELADELAPFGFADVGGDTNLLLRCCSAVLADDAAPEALMSLNGASVRANFDRITNGVKYAVDFVRTNFNAQTLNNLPFTTLLVPLSVFFAVPGTKQKGYTKAQAQQISRWFWRAAFSKRYASGVLRNLKVDIVEMKNLRDGKPSNLGNFSVKIEPSFFTENAFGLGNVNTKTFILMLAGEKPLSFVSGSPVDLAATLKEANRAEFHHLMPRAFIAGLDEGTRKAVRADALANFCFLSRADNQALGGVAPSIYRKKMAANEVEILARSLVNPTALFGDKPTTFVLSRAKALADKANELCQSNTVASA